MRRIFAFVLICVGAALPTQAEAFCGFFVAGADSRIYNNATVVALMRDGTRTALSMQNDYQGPPKDFAMVVPVPVVLQKDNVRTLPTAIFDRLDSLASPRLVEYWERDPCKPMPRPMMKSTSGVGFGASASRGSKRPRAPKVKVEAQFKVGEYEIVILSATEALALENWITQNGYKIPPGAAKHLAPYVQNGWKFFVAKVDPKKVKFKAGRAVLSPLRFYYDTQDFALPIRLGLINSSGEQDLIVHILARNQRYEVANYDNVAIPTNLRVRNSTRKKLGPFYEGLLRDTWSKHPGAVITEYAWSAMSCDPCPGQPLSTSELATLGLDVMPGSRGASAAGLIFDQVRVSGQGDPARYQAYLRRAQRRVRRCVSGNAPGSQGFVQMDISGKGRAKVNVMGPLPYQTRQCIEQELSKIRFPPATSGEARVMARMRLLGSIAPRTARSFVLTRLHARYSAKTVGDDLVFRAAPAINGGTGGAQPTSEVAMPSGRNTFQGRYIIRHNWRGKVACKNPRRGIWGGPPRGKAPPIAASGQAFQRKRKRINAKRQVRGKIPTLTVSKAQAVAAIKPRPVAPPPPPPPPDAGVVETPSGPAPAVATDTAMVDAGAAGAPTGTPVTTEPQVPPQQHKADRGCGCRTGGDTPIGALMLAVGIAFALRRRSSSVPD